MDCNNREVNLTIILVPDEVTVFRSPGESIKNLTLGAKA